MRAIVLEQPGDLHEREWPDPVCGSGDVVLRPIATGICAGDLYLYEGKNPYAKYPLIGGHEVCGDVVETGADVTRFKRGDRVVIEPVVGCGKCYPCSIGKSNCCMNFCLLGLHRPGGFAEFMLAPEKNVHASPPGLDPVTASFAEPVTIGIQACRRAQVEPGEYVLVLGAGPIGLAILEVARLKGARVVVSDVQEKRLEFARKLGAETLPADDQLLPTVLRETGGAGAPVVIEATGNVKAVESTIHLVAPGGRVVIVGLVKKGIDASFPALDFTRKEATILGSRNSVNAIPEALALLASGALHYPKVATCFPMWEGVRIFSEIATDPARYHKGVLVLES
jgi:L-gulonate 5-dehydrogenase